MSKIIPLREHIVEIVSDAGEGAQKAGTTFAEVCARSGNGLWTVEIIPSEIQPPPHTVGSASGNRIRIADRAMTNGGDLTNFVVAFNEMALLSRIQTNSLAKDVIVLIDNQWATHTDPQICKQYREILDGVKSAGGTVWELPIEAECCKVIEDPSKGKNMFIVGMLVKLYNKEIEVAKTIVRELFGKKSSKIVQQNMDLLDAGYIFGTNSFEYCFQIEPMTSSYQAVSRTSFRLAASGWSR